MASANFLSRSKLWSLVDDRPRGNLLGYFFKRTDPWSSNSLVKTLGINFQKDAYVLIDPSVNGGKSVFLAIPFVVTKIACDDKHLAASGTSSAPSDAAVATIHPGLNSTLIDTITSYHMGEQNLPNVTMHVTTSLSVKNIGTAVEGDTLIALSQIDSIKDKLLHSQMRIIRDPSEDVLNDWISNNCSTQGGTCNSGSRSDFDNATSIQKFVREYDDVIATGQHIKMFVDVPILNGVPPFAINLFSSFLKYRGY